MRELLQQGWAKGIILFIFGLIIIAFVLFFGPQSQGYAPGTARWIAKIDGQPILNTTVDATYERYRRTFGQRTRMPEDEFAELRRQFVLNDTIVHLLAERAEQSDLAVSYDEVRCYIVNWHQGYVVKGERLCQQFPEWYQERYVNTDLRFYSEVDGSFSDSYARDVRVNFGMAVEEYEAGKARELLALKYLDLVRGMIEVAPEEVAALHARRNETVDLEFVRLDPASAAIGEITDEDVATFLAENAAEVQASYDGRVDEFSTARQVQIRRIYIRKPADTDTEALAAAEASYQEALRRVTEGGEDFEAVARELTELEREREEGGDMGMRSADTLASDLVDATAEMAVGDVQGVEQTFAWNVIKLEAVEEARTQPLSEVEGDVARGLIEDARRAEAAVALIARGEALLALAADAESLAAAAALEAGGGDAEGDDAEGDDAAAPAEALAVATTGAFAREQPSPFASLAAQNPGIVLPPTPADEVPNIGASRDLMRLAFELSADAPLHGELVEVDGAHFVVRLAERVEAPGEISDEEYDALHAELQSALADGLTGGPATRFMLTADQPGEYAPYLQALIDEAIDQGRVELRPGAFEVDPVDSI